MRCCYGGDILEMHNQVDWQARAERGVQDDAVDGGCEQRGDCLDRRVGEDVFVLYCG